MLTDNDFKKKLGGTINKVAWEILDEIVAPICEIDNIFADLFLATLNEYCTSDEEHKKPILDKIAERYKVDRDSIGKIAEGPLVLMALYVVLNEGEADRG